LPQSPCIIPWPGGKRRLAKRLVAMIPEHRCYVEPFAGAAAVLFHKPPSDVEVLNDVNLDLVNLYRVVQHHLDELVRQFRWSLVSRTMFEWAKMQRPETLTDVQRAARFYYLQRTAFGSKVVGQNFGVSPTVPPRLNLLRMEEELSHAHLRLARVLVEALPWQQICPRYDRPGTVFFCDPPYWDTVGYGVPFGLSEYKALARFMRSAAGKVLLTINDHPAMREVFRRFEFEAVDITYTIGGQGRSSPVRELVYRSWKAP
jgi:DNA adenine methylase